MFLLSYMASTIFYFSCFLMRMCIEPKNMRKFSWMKDQYDVKCFGSIRSSCIAEAQKRECLTREIMQDYVDHWLSYVSVDRPIENRYYVQVDHIKLSIYLKILPSSTIHLKILSKFDLKYTEYHCSYKNHSMCECISFLSGLSLYCQATNSFFSCVLHIDLFFCTQLVPHNN